jgi:hypothetical protein
MGCRGNVKYRARVAFVRVALHTVFGIENDEETVSSSQPFVAANPVLSGGKHDDDDVGVERCRGDAPLRMSAKCVIREIARLRPCLARALAQCGPQADHAIPGQRVAAAGKRDARSKATNVASETGSFFFVSALLALCTFVIASTCYSMRCRVNV